MKIRSIETFVHAPNVGIVRVRTEDGSEGYGQVSTFNADITATVLHRQVAPVVLGRDIEDLDSLCDEVIEATYKFPGSYVCRALTGVDTAIWDLQGQGRGQERLRAAWREATPLPRLWIEHATRHHARGRGSAARPSCATSSAIARSKFASARWPATMKISGRVAPRR